MWGVGEWLFATHETLETHLALEDPTSEHKKHMLLVERHAEVECKECRQSVIEGWRNSKLHKVTHNTWIA